MKRGTLVQGSTLLLGPHAGDASFKLTGIKSIAYKRLPVAKVRAAWQSARQAETCHALLEDPLHHGEAMTC